MWDDFEKIIVAIVVFYAACGEPVVCLPDGLALCEPCAKRERIEQ